MQNCQQYKITLKIQYTMNNNIITNGDILKAYDCTASNASVKDRFNTALASICVDNYDIPKLYAKFFRVKDAIRKRKVNEDEVFYELTPNAKLPRKQPKCLPFNEASSKTKKRRTEPIMGQIQEAAGQLEISPLELICYLGYRLSYQAHKTIADSFLQIEKCLQGN